jgi:hypothetical protein
VGEKTISGKEKIMKTNKLALVLTIMVSLVAASSAFAITAGDCYGSGTGTITNGTYSFCPWGSWTGHHSTGYISGKLYNQTGFSGTVDEGEFNIDYASGTWSLLYRGYYFSGGFIMDFHNAEFMGDGWFMRDITGEWTLTSAPSGWYLSGSSFATINGYEYVCEIPTK